MEKLNDMTHAIYLSIIGLLVAAGLWLLNQLRKLVDEKLEKDERLDEIMKALNELFEYANSGEKEAVYQLGDWEKPDGTVIKGLKLYNEAYLACIRNEVKEIKKNAQFIKDEYKQLHEKSKNTEKEIEQLNKSLRVTTGLFRKNRLARIDAEEQIEKLEAENEALKISLERKLQSAYGRIGALTQQLNRAKRAGKPETNQTKEPESKPAAEWFQQLNSPIREWAIENIENDKDEYIGIEGALCRSFTWDKTPQGYALWANLYSLIRAGRQPETITLADLPKPKNQS